MGLIDSIRDGTFVPDDDPVGPAPGSAVTLAQAGERIGAGEDRLFVARDFLDQLGRLSRAALLDAIEERPPATGDVLAEALLGALAEYVAAGLDAPTPGWACEPGRFLERFWFVSRVPGLRAISLAQTPVALKRRGILWPARSLERV